MLSKEQYIRLYEKYTDGTCSQEELQQLETYQDDFQIVDTPWDNASMGRFEDVKERIYKQLKSGINKDSTVRSQRHIWIKWGAVAASFLIIMSVVWMIQRDKETIRSESISSKSNIIPGGNKATLILEDGTQVDLENAESGAIINKGRYVAVKVGEGKLEYRDEKTGPTSAVSYHTLRTPNGGQFQVGLPDGTIAWLNAASSITYPTAFVGTERKVEISGEVYFDVKKQNSKHFVVKTNDQEITVLGTRFNVFAYPEESFVKTSLVEGKIQLDIKDQQVMLKPGLSSVVNKYTNKIRITSFDPDEVLAWQQGYFNFNSEDIESVMRKISRWYDVEVIYEGDMKGKIFTGALSRFSNVQEILDVMTLTGVVKFKIKGRKIYVIGN
ncbi:FecR family protein [Sphingobacterium spiritivorum]|uniref:FecR family protein n=1 Tax=Sphingobacterium spiritivorum TaxID=258 RepID=UPI003DA59312